MVVGLKLNGKFVGVDPAAPETVYADRDALGPWEQWRLDDAGPDRYVATAVESGVVLSLTPDLHLETRPAGTSGVWERQRGLSAPPEWAPKLVSDYGLVLDVVPVEA